MSFKNNKEDFKEDKEICDKRVQKNKQFYNQQLNKKEKKKRRKF